MILPVQWQLQPDERWCWATVGSIVSTYYSQRNGSPALIPCQVAAMTLGTPCCPPGPVTPPPPPPQECQTALDLERALDAIGHLNPNALPASGFELVQEEIGNLRPLCAMVKFNGGPFHYMVVHGFDLPSQQIMIADPASSAFPMPFQTFLANSNFVFNDWILTE